MVTSAHCWLAFCGILADCVKSEKPRAYTKEGPKIDKTTTKRHQPRRKIDPRETKGNKKRQHKTKRDMTKTKSASTEHRTKKTKNNDAESTTTAGVERQIAFRTVLLSTQRLFIHVDRQPNLTEPNWNRLAKGRTSQRRTSSGAQSHRTQRETIRKVMSLTEPNRQPVLDVSKEPSRNRNPLAN